MRYLRYPFALTLLLTAAITGALLIGRAQPLPDRVAVLHLNDMCKLPCWIGITPGVTTFAEAEKLVQTVYKTSKKFVLSPQGSYDSTLDIHIPNGSLSITLEPEHAMDITRDPNHLVVSSLTLNIYDLSISLGDLYLVMGSPYDTVNYPYQVDVGIKNIAFMLYGMNRVAIINAVMRPEIVYSTIASIILDAPYVRWAHAIRWHGFKAYPVKN